MFVFSYILIKQSITTLFRAKSEESDHVLQTTVESNRWLVLPFIKFILQQGSRGSVSETIFHNYLLLQSTPRASGDSEMHQQHGILSGRVSDAKRATLTPSNNLLCILMQVAMRKSQTHALTMHQLQKRRIWRVTGPNGNLH